MSLNGFKTVFNEVYSCILGDHLVCSYTPLITTVCQYNEQCCRSIQSPLALNGDIATTYL